MFKRTFGPPALILLLTCNGASAADKAGAAPGSQKPLSATEQLALIRAAAHARHQEAQAAAAASTATASLVPATGAVAAPAPTTANTAPLSLKRPRDTEATASRGGAAAAQRIRYAAPTGAAAAGSSSGADDVEYIGDTAGVRPPDATREEVLVGSAASNAAGGGYALGAGAEQAAIDASLAAFTHCGSCNELLPSGPDEKMQLDCTHWICCACVESYNTIGCQHCPVSVRRGTVLRAGNIVVDGSDDDDDADLAAALAASAAGTGAAQTGGGSASGAGGADASGGGASGAGNAKPAVPEKNCCIQ